MTTFSKPAPGTSGYLFALCATALWSGNFVIARGLSDQIPPVTLAFCRWLTAVAVFTPFAVSALIREWQPVKKHAVYLAVTGLLGISIFNTLIYIAGHTTSAMNLSLIAISFPIFIIIFSRIIHKEPITLRKIFGIVLVLTGVVCLITKGDLALLLHLHFNRGDVWMALAAAIFAVHSILVKNKPPAISVKTLQLSTMILGLFFLFPFFLWEQQFHPDPFLTKATIPAILYVGIFASLCAFILWAKSIMIIGPSKAGIIYYTLPLFSGLSAILFLNEQVGFLHLFSLCFIITGIFIANHQPDRSSA